MASEENKLDKNTENRIKKDIDSLLEEKELKIKWRQELEENDSITQYLKQFNPHSVTGFFDSYLTSKYQWYRFGDMYRDMIEAAREEWITAAHEHLENILHKKLFDLQCLWRANEIKLEGVEICFDFQNIGADIFNCKFIDDITEQEIEMYQEFLMKGDVEHEKWFDFLDMQDYDEIKDAYNNENSDYNFPDWYDFHNVRTGNSSLFLLPNSRGDEEEFYISLHFKNQRENTAKEIESGIKQAHVPDPRPFLAYHDKEQIKFFVATFENKEFQKKHKYYTEGFENNFNDNYDIDELFMKMNDIEEPIPIKAHYDFRQALVQAYNDYRNKKIAEHMPIAHEQYLFTKQMGFGFEKKHAHPEARNSWLSHILNGRELNGEERNLDF
jgi:hypothetical protein